MSVTIQVTSDIHQVFSDQIVMTMQLSAKKRGTGIAKRSPSYISEKMRSGDAIIATVDGKLAGFCYIETWSNARFVANSGLIVVPEFRGKGLGTLIKEAIKKLSLSKYPSSNIFGITTSKTVMKINSDLGYVPVVFSDLTDDQRFWDGCKTCVNYDILTRLNRSNCLCTAMIFDPKSNESNHIKTTENEKDITCL